MRILLLWSCVSLYSDPSSLAISITLHRISSVFPQTHHFCSFASRWRPWLRSEPLKTFLCWKTTSKQKPHYNFHMATNDSHWKSVQTAVENPYVFRLMKTVRPEFKSVHLTLQYAALETVDQSETKKPVHYQIIGNPIHCFFQKSVHCFKNPVHKQKPYTGWMQRLYNMKTVRGLC